MPDPIFTIPEPEHFPDTQADSPIIPTAEWGIMGLLLIGVGILIGSQWQRRQHPPAPSTTPHQQPDPSGFTQAMHWISRGKALEQQAQYEAAIAIYDQGLAQHANHFRLWHERGLAFAKLEYFESALDSFDRAYQLRPNDSDLAHERGDTLLQLERYEEAIVSFDIYLRYHPDSSHILTDRGYALCYLGRFEEALSCLQRVLQIERHDLASLSRAHFYQIEALRYLGQLSAALQSSLASMARYEDASFAAQRETLRQQIADQLANESPQSQPDKIAAAGADHPLINSDESDVQHNGIT